MKPQKWRRSLCTFFCNSQWFLVEAETISLQTVLVWVFVKCSYLLKPYWNYVFRVSLLSISKRQKNEYNFHAGVLCCYKFLLRLVLKKVLCYRHQIVCLLLFIVPKIASLMDSRKWCIENPVEHIRWNFLRE